MHLKCDFKITNIDIANSNIQVSKLTFLAMTLPICTPAFGFTSQPMVLGEREESIIVHAIIKHQVDQCHHHIPYRSSTYIEKT